MPMIENFPQAIRYSGDAERIFFLVKDGGAEASPDAAPTIDVFDPAGTELLSDQTMTQIGTTSWYYLEIDASTVATWYKGLNYRGTVTFDISSVEKVESIFFDCCAWPLDDPLVTSEEVDKVRPTWQSMRPSAWGDDWTTPIAEAHKEMAEDLRNMRIRGDYLRPFMVLSRTKLAQAEMRYVLAHIVQGLSEDLEEIERYVEMKNSALDSMGPITVDLDGDLTVDDDEDDLSVGQVDLRR